MTLENAKCILNTKRREKLNDKEVKEILILLEVFADIVYQNTKRQHKHHKATQTPQNTTHHE